MLIGSGTIKNRLRFNTIPAFVKGVWTSVEIDLSSSDIAGQLEDIFRFLIETPGAVAPMQIIYFSNIYFSL